MATAVRAEQDDQVLDVEGACAFLKVSESWLRRSDVPRAKLGGRVVFLRSQLLAYVARRLSHRVDLPQEDP